MASRFRLLLVFCLAIVLLDAVSGVIALQSQADAQDARSAARFAAVEQRIIDVQASLVASRAALMKTDAAATALAARVVRVERGVAALNLATDISAQLNDLRDQTTGLDSRLSSVELTLGSARNRYCRFGIVDCINSLELRFGP